MGVTSDKAVWEAESFGYDLADITIGDLLDQQAEKFADNEALVYSTYDDIGINVRWTYRQYREVANQLAKGMLALGIEKGEHVAIWAPNVPQWMVVFMASAKIGAVLVTVNTAYRQSELEYVLRQGDITTLFLVEEARGNPYLQSLYESVPELREIENPAQTIVESNSLPCFKRAVLIGKEARPGVLLYEDVIKLGASISDDELKARQATVTPHDVGMIQYTSGTTGFPKGAEMTHYSLVNNSRLGALRGEYSPEDRLVTPLPLFHVAGCVLAGIGCLSTGAAMIPLLSFDPSKQLETIAKERGTRSGGVPAMLVALLNHPRFLSGEFDLSSLKAVGSGAASVPVSLMEQVKDKFGADIGIIYGMTETSGAITSTRQTDSNELKSSTVGVPVPFAEVKIADPLTGEAVNFGEKGELWTRGFLTMQSYYNMPEKTAETIMPDGWLRTGDLATMNADGYINIVGRLKDMIIRGGENIYPAEVEDFFMRHPKIAEAQVVGVPDAYMGEEAIGLLRLKPGETATEEEIREYCKGKISHYKIPKYIRFVTEYPMTASGKIKKFELRKQLIEDLNLTEVAATKMA